MNHNLLQLHGCNPVDKLAYQERRVTPIKTQRYKCPGCKMTFRNSAAMELHRQEKHGK